MEKLIGNKLKKIIISHILIFETLEGHIDFINSNLFFKKFTTPESILKFLLFIFLHFEFLQRSKKTSSAFKILESLKSPL